MHWYLDVLKKYAVFSGRARRQEYWMFFLFNILIIFALAFIEVLLSPVTANARGTSGGNESVLASIYQLAVLLPTLAVAVRRLHDTGRSGWWLLIALIPLVGGIILLVWLAQDSQSGDNSYGPNPKLLTA